jgi:phage shock protein PspC (stress-responsive transcriptional regulator)
MNEDSDPRPGSDGGPDVGSPAGPEPRRLTRSQEGRLITGVCAGLARYTRIDPIVFRVAFALLVITTGVGIFLYIAAFLLMGAPDGGPSQVERVGKRILDGDTALALLGAALAAGMLLGIVSNWGSGDALSVVVVFGLTLLVARSRGVDLVQVTRGLPDGMKGRPLASWVPPAPPPPAYPMSDGMVDLARLGRRTDTYAAGPYAPPESRPEPLPTDPYGTDQYGTSPYVKAPAPRARRHSYLTALTLLLAALVAAALYSAVGDRPHFGGLQIVIAGALAVVACGLFLGAWFGRDRELVLVGAIMSFALASTSIAGNASVARRTHHMMWRPAVTTQAEQSHKVIIGQGVVDLTTVPLSPGQRLQVSAEVTLGVLAVKVPSTARVEVDGQAFLGDITVDRQVTSGPRARVRRVLEPESSSKTTGLTPATIVLRIRSKVGDMEVTRVPA